MKKRLILCPALLSLCIVSLSSCDSIKEVDDITKSIESYENHTKITSQEELSISSILFNTFLNSSALSNFDGINNLAKDDYIFVRADSMDSKSKLGDEKEVAISRNNRTYKFDKSNGVYEEETEASEKDDSSVSKLSRYSYTGIRFQTENDKVRVYDLDNETSSVSSSYQVNEQAYSRIKYSIEAIHLLFEESTDDISYEYFYSTSSDKQVLTAKKVVVQTKDGITTSSTTVEQYVVTKTTFTCVEKQEVIVNGTLSGKTMDANMVYVTSKYLSIEDQDIKPFASDYFKEISYM